MFRWVDTRQLARYGEEWLCYRSDRLFARDSCGSASCCWRTFAKGILPGASSSPGGKELPSLEDARHELHTCDFGLPSHGSKDSKSHVVNHKTGELRALCNTDLGFFLSGLDHTRGEALPKRLRDTFLGPWSFGCQLGPACAVVSPPGEPGHTRNCAVTLRKLRRCSRWCWRWRDILPLGLVQGIRMIPPWLRPGEPFRLRKLVWWLEALLPLKVAP